MVVYLDEMTFIHIPKTGGISITNWFIKNFASKIKSNMSNIRHPSTEMTDLKTPETFTVVRNPWDRVVSLWAFWNKIKKQDVPFDDFVRNLHNYKFHEAAWFTFDQPQKAWIPNGVTYLLKFETLDEDFKLIQEKFNCTEPLCHINSTKHAYYKTYYTLETWNIVSEIFKDDIETFGYENQRFVLMS